MNWWYGLATILTILVAIIITKYLTRVSKPISLKEYKDQHVVITGGSSGLGQEIARQLYHVGAIVTIVARGEEQLKTTKQTIEDEKTSEDAGQINIISCDVTNEEAAAAMITRAESMGGPIYALFCCAGSAQPGFFLDQSPSIFYKQMKLNYMGVVNCLHPALQRITRYGTQKLNSSQQRKVILVSSTLGLTGMVGYSQYAPTKFALRGLAESLRQELLPWRTFLAIHVYYVATITSPGHTQEQLTKPAITKKIEEGDQSDDPSPQARARTLLQGIALRKFAITSDHITDIFWTAGMGAAPGNNTIYDILTIPFAHWGLAIWRRYADWLTIKMTGPDKKVPSS